MKPGVPMTACDTRTLLESLNQLKKKPISNVYGRKREREKGGECGLIFATMLKEKSSRTTATRYCSQISGGKRKKREERETLKLYNRESKRRARC